MKGSPFRVLGLLALLGAAALHLMELDAFARAGGGRSFGSRGSRTYSSPSRPPVTSPSRPQPAAPQAQPRPATPTPVPQPAPAVSPLWRSLAGGVLGGFLGAMLFRGIAGAAGFGGLGAPGIGLMDILFLAAIGFGIYWWVKKRREQAVPAEGYYERQAAAGRYAAGAEEATATQEAPSPREDLERGLAHIRTMDPRFEEAAFPDRAMDSFFKIQAGWMNRDADAIADLLTVEMQNEFRRELARLKAEGRVNRLENIAVRAVEITEAWQEAGQDYITVHFVASVLDYTVDERTGQVLEGSRAEPVKFEEYWTWTRPVGPNPWRLGAIQQAD